jgi:hypothetical protein
MVMNQKSSRSGCLLALLAAATWVAACSPEASPGASGTGGGSGASGGRGGSGGSAGRGGSSGGSGGQGGSATGGAGGSSTAGTGGSGGGSGGAGGSAGQSGTGGSAGTGGAGGSGSGDAAGEAASEVASHQVPGYGLCLPCHGPEGAGVPMMGPEIQHPVVDFSTWVVRNGRTHPDYKMPMMKYPPEVLPDTQLQGIFTFLASRPKPTTGAGLYKDYCENCHGSNAQGGVTMRPIANEPVNVFITDTRAGHHPGEFSNRREYMPKWTAAELSDAEIRLIFMYVDGL